MKNLCPLNGLEQCKDVIVREKEYLQKVAAVNGKMIVIMILIIMIMDAVCVMDEIFKSSLHVLYTNGICMNLLHLYALKE